MCFTIFQREETPFQAVKTRSSKRKKKWRFFSKGFSTQFWSKVGSFFQIFFQGKQGKKYFYDILEERNAFQDYKNKKFKNSKNWDFFKRVSPWFWSKIDNFFQISMLGKISQKNVFTIFLKEETPFQTVKTKSSKSQKIEIFPKGLVHGFGQILVIFPEFDFKENDPEKCLLGYSRRKKRLSRL